MKVSPATRQLIFTALLSAVFTVVLLSVTNYFFNHSWNLFSGSSSKQLFTVEGTSTLTQKPDQAEITFTVTKTASVLVDAQNQANTSTNRIVADLQKIGIAKKDIKTSNYSSSPTYENDNMKIMQIMPPQGGQTITGYTVSENVVVTLVDVAKANKVIDTVTKDGAENIFGPNLTFSQNTQDALVQKARIEAIGDAKAKAQALANAAGIRLGRIVNIQESNTPYPIRPMMLKISDTAGGSAPTEINPGENTITETVTLSYETW